MISSLNQATLGSGLFTPILWEIKNMEGLKDGIVRVFL